MMTPNRVGKRIENYVFTKVLGKGAFGEVFQATHVITRQTVAIKCVPQERRKENNGLVGEMLNTEISVLQQCQNRNVVKLITYLESSNQCYLVLEYCNEGDFEILWKNKGKRFPEKEAVQYLKQLLNGMKGLHELNVIHRDLKLPNILMHDGVLKIADLGFATTVKSKSDNNQTVSLGSLGNMAPEVIEGKRYGLLVDIFSIGTIYYQMLFGCFPFSASSTKEFIYQIKNQPPNLVHQGVPISQMSKDLLTRMLQYDPAHRMKWTEIYQHPLIQDNANIADISKPISFNYLENKKVNGQQNQNMYEKKEKQTEVTDENMLKMMEQRQPKITVIKTDVSHFESEDNQFLKQIQQIEEQEMREKLEIKEVMKKYFNLRNKYTFLPKTFECMQGVQNSTSGNPILAGFVLMKKLLLESINLIEVIDRRKNIFNTNLLDQVYKSEPFIEFYEIIQEESLHFRVQFDELLLQASEIKDQLKEITPQQREEIQQEVTKEFNAVYSEILMNYYFQLEKENESEKNSKSKNLKMDLELHILDCIQYDKKLNDKLNLINFSFHTYFDEVQNFDERQKAKIIVEKFNELFS